jgi:hypothetical protein
MHKNATKCNKTQSKWCINKHGSSKIIDTFEMYQVPPRQRRKSSHAPLGMISTQDEHELHQAPNRGKSGFPSKGRNIPIEAVREERKGRKTAWLR